MQPTIYIRISFLPKRPDNSRDTDNPILFYASKSKDTV